MTARRLKVLMFAEAVTLAHVARPIALAKALDRRRYDITIACDPRYAAFASEGHWNRLDMSSIPGAQFLRALERGTPVFDFSTLAAYAEDDARLIASVRPDLVVGDFRLSLSVSARRARIPYLAIANAYWSPKYARPFPLPVLPLSRALPIPIAAALFSAFRPLAFALHCKPMNRLRAQHGMPALGNDLRQVYTDADHLLVPDIEALHPLAAAPDRHTFLGPLMWSPDVPEPPWWSEQLDADIPVVYLAMGSSGSQNVLEAVLRALDGLPIRVLASSAGLMLRGPVPENARLAPYLRGDAAASRSRLVICNGGSLATQQSLAAGVPVLGIASNMDQFFNMGPLQEQGAGSLLRADRLSASLIRDSCMELVRSERALAAARRLQPLLRDSVNPADAFDRVVDKLGVR